MNKTIIININGTVFHIEESAYEILKQYMTAVKRHFFDSEDSLEITTDIENRIAELFSEILLREGRQAVIEQDVNYVISQMGAVEDFEMAAEDGEPVAFAYQTRTDSRRLFRDPDDHLIGGVCAGIANYFDIQPVWIRLAFAITTLFAGTGLFLYIILWLVIPKAATRADRMAMKGEKLNLEGFKKNFEAELGNVRDRMADVHHEARPFIYKFRDFIGEFFSFVGLSAGQIGKLFLKLIGFAFLASFFCMAIALIVLLVSVLGFGQDLHFVFPFSVISYQYMHWIYLSAFVVGMIPLIALILILSALVFNTQGISRSTGSTLIIVWICAISIFIYFTVRVTSNFRSSASFEETLNIKPTKGNVYYLKLNTVKYFTSEDSARLDIQKHFHGMIVTDGNDDEDTEPRNVDITVEKSDVAQPVLIERYKAKGRDYDNALNNARDTHYTFTQKDSVLNFDYKLHRTGKTPWHSEEIELILRVPLNSTVIVDKELQRYTGLGIYSCIDDNKNSDATTATFTMTNNGLQCKVDTLKLKRDSVTAANDSTSADTVKVLNHVKR